MVLMVLLLWFLKVISYGSQGHILLVVMPSVFRDEYIMVPLVLLLAVPKGQMLLEAVPSVFRD